MNSTRAVLSITFAAVAAGCASVVNYQEPMWPRYAGLPPVRPAGVRAASPPADATSRTVRVVTYNVQWAKHIDRAINVLQNREPLMNADIVVLQEMDPEGTRRIADALGMQWVYYPAVIHPKRGLDFGNAVLSRWPIVADRKLILPHIGGIRHSQRIATAVTVLIDSVPVQVYSAHLGTPTEIRPSKRRDQARTIVEDASHYPLVIVAGDMNSHGIGKEFVTQGFSWPTQHNGFTTTFFTWDHVFLKGFVPPLAAQKAAGVVRDTLHTSDHDPVWAVAQLP
ncbi:MAG TPA: endonuclease/exonuclease/phosphatase family protein [Gemmatimonadales bacterium]|nr:endonuclease/exonuclease/phosphatase family protein [Gemmatimonadales bacterium]